MSIDIQLANALNELEKTPFFTQWLINMFTVECATTNPQLTLLIDPVDWFSWSKSKEGFTFWSAIAASPSKLPLTIDVTYDQFKQFVRDRYKHKYPEYTI
jgi:hypothetical protein